MDLLDVSGMGHSGMPSGAQPPAMAPSADLDPRVSEWNRTERNFPLDKCIHQLLEEQVNATPESIAVMCDGTSLTYEELNMRANALARHLRSLGVGPDVLVGLCTTRTPEMVISLLAILKAGGAYVPMDPGYPDERLRYVLEDTGLKVVLTQRHLAGQFPRENYQVVHIDEPLTKEAPENPECVNSPGDLAYIIYTSGSTGKPKGVAIEHHNAVSFLCWVGETFTAEEFSGVLGATSICFDLSVFELFGALCSGGTIILVDSALDLGACPHRHEVTLVNTVPSVMQALLKSQSLPESVITVNLAGEPLRPSLVDALHAFPHIRRVNDLYGPSETTTYSTWTTRLPQQAATIGRPIANTKVYILGENLEPLPVGATGELFIGGEGVARGYLNAPDLTAGKFLPDPFSGRPGGRLYRTGDLVRYFPDGNLEYLGRTDHQVKIRGYRVEPGEIENALSAHPDLAACSVVAEVHGDGEKSLSAFVVARQPAGLSIAALRSWLGGQLPEFMLPSRFFLLPEMPLTPNGKIDRSALGKLDATDLDSGKSHTPPRTETEQELVAIWEKLLDRAPIGVLDSFFDLGGNSLLAAQLAAELKNRWGDRLPVAAMFQSPTIEELAQRLTGDAWSPSWKSLVPLQKQGTKPPLFLIHGWGGDVYCFVNLARQLGPDQPVYGLQAIGLNGNEPRHTDVSTMAAHYVREILAFQPDGPYCIGGYSLGGVFAYEVARHLHLAGKQVAMLALLDSDPVGVISWMNLPYLGERCAFHLRRLWKMSIRERLEYCHKCWIELQLRKSPGLEPKAQPAAGFERMSPQDPHAEDYFHSLTLAHRLKRYPGPATVFVSDDSVPGHMKYWRHLVRGGINYHEIPGTHFEILAAENLPRLVAAMRDELAKEWGQ